MLLLFSFFFMCAHMCMYLWRSEKKKCWKTWLFRLKCGNPVILWLQCNRHCSEMVSVCKVDLTFMLRHAIGWNLRVCLLWLTGVESSINSPARTLVVIELGVGVGWGDVTECIFTLCLCYYTLYVALSLSFMCGRHLIFYVCITCCFLDVAVRERERKREAIPTASRVMHSIYH